AVRWPHDIEPRVKRNRATVRLQTRKRLRDRTCRCSLLRHRTHRSQLETVVLFAGRTRGACSELFSEKPLQVPVLPDCIRCSSHGSKQTHEFAMDVFAKRIAGESAPSQLDCFVEVT